MSSTSTIKRRLAIQLGGARVDTSDAHTAALRLLPHLPQPGLVEHISPPSGEACPALLHQPFPALAQWPAALFDSQPQISAAELPQEWLAPYLAWVIRQARWQDFKTLCSDFQAAATRCGFVESLPVTDAVTAGMLLFQLGPDPAFPIRQKLLELALSQPVGAYLAAEGLHLSEERHAIAEAMRGNSQLLYWASQISGLAQHCQMNDNDLWSSLRCFFDKQQTPHWERRLQRLATIACDTPEAAQAALVLQPAAPAGQKDVWIETIQRASEPRLACETVWWARHTWGNNAWSDLKDRLRSTAISDRGRWWHHWSLLEPEFIYQNYQEQAADPLWTVEILATRGQQNLPADDRCLRTRMVERLIRSHGDPMANLVIQHLNNVRNGRAAA